MYSFSSSFFLIGAQVTVVGGAEGVNAVATETEANVVVTGIVGCAGLLPTIEAIKVNMRCSKSAMTMISLKGVFCGVML